ncbi:leucine-rich repeat and fibronectin type-III domain-containing protein 3 [Frankliniella occidentalis]|uniref:Leucine-rich repeat and fibronectin type-III domain-containing protein 3 n=1 Tax=Frankliniella occidentalis TaxID=133901 RepID=A0A9C6WYD5_FRAOC|nr:leucine-rich repeat and fibronectin type-III domain-containing protein 3 [Frankliniella occidentalis]
MLVLLVLAALLTRARCPPPTAPVSAPVPALAAPSHGAEETQWVCPQIGVEWEPEEEEEEGGWRRAGDGGDDADVKQRPVTCSCDLPHTLRCTGGLHTLQVVGTALRALPPRYVSLLDVSLSGVSALGSLLPGVALHGLVVSGELKSVEPDAFTSLLLEAGEPRLQALGLPSNLLEAVPASALSALPDLDRLDLSHNRLRSLPTDAFPGLSNLTFLDLSDNLLTDISAGAFRSLSSLQTLRLTGNRLRVAPLSLSLLDGLEGLRGLRELDLSSNQLAGPLGPGALPRLPNLRVLNLAHNQVSSVRRGALAGLPQLSSLALPHNMVDVLEDHAFRQLGSLASLDLAHNRIVAVGGASLAHLQRLRSLALQHNFLRVLTADLLRPLAALQELHLDDNDISQVADDALEALEAAAPRLTRLTLAENPLNCDCALGPFARWLRRNATRVPSADRASAVCAAPPHLENGLVEDVAEGLCQDDAGAAEAVAEEDAALRPGPGPQHHHADARVQLRGFQFDGARAAMLWAVNVSAAPYVCDTLLVYEEEEGGREVPRDSTPLGCDSSQLDDPHQLLVSLPAAPHLQPARRYRYCLVLLVGGGSHDDLAIVVGCSDVLPLVKTASAAVAVAEAETVAIAPTSSVSVSAPSVASAAAAVAAVASPRISGLSANVTATGALAVWVQLSPATAAASCRLSVSVFAGGILAAQELLNCSLPGTVLRGLGPGAGPLQVCAAAGEAASRMRCTSVSWPQRSSSAAASSGAITASLMAALTGSALLGGSVAALLLFLWASSRWRRRGGRVRGRRGGGLGLDQDTGQLYRPAPAPEYEQHARYVKLQATTKL